MTKHLTDAECAAHYWQTDAEAANTWEATYPFHDFEHPLWPKHIQAQHEHDTWHRFATTPHAHERGYQ